MFPGQGGELFRIPLGLYVCVHAQMRELAWDGGDDMEKQCWGMSALAWSSHSQTCAR